MNLQANLLAPEAMPPRDAEGWATHPDLDQLLRDPTCPDGSVDEELYLDPDKVKAAGYTFATVALDAQANDDDLAYQEYFTFGQGCRLWEPDPPAGEGWRLVAVYDTDDGPAALYVQPLADAGVPA